MLYEVITPANRFICLPRIETAAHVDQLAGRLPDDVDAQQFAGVITSYSIHYTKLYDLFQGVGSDGLDELRHGGIDPGAAEGGVEVDEPVGLVDEAAVGALFEEFVLPGVDDVV